MCVFELQRVMLRVGVSVLSLLSPTLDVMVVFVVFENAFSTSILVLTLGVCEKYQKRIISEVNA